MVNSVHVTVAAAIVIIVPNPWLALPLALVSHIALDTVPHWNWKPGGNGLRLTGSILDIVLAALISLYFIVQSTNPWIIGSACLLSTIPDLIQGPYYFLQFRPAWLCSFISWESRRQKWPWMPIWFGLSTQAITFIIGVVIILQFQ